MDQRVHQCIDNQTSVDQDAAETLCDAVVATVAHPGLLKRLFDAVMSGVMKAAPSAAGSVAAPPSCDTVHAITGH
jgi:hypothetical protein